VKAGNLGGMSEGREVILILPGLALAQTMNDRNEPGFLDRLPDLFRLNYPAV
jgi:hypothetical protein